MPMRDEELTIDTGGFLLAQAPADMLLAWSLEQSCGHACAEYSVPEHAIFGANMRASLRSDTEADSARIAKDTGQARG